MSLLQDAPLLRRMVRDKDLSPRDTHIWIIAAEQLTVGVFRDLKVRGLAEEMEVSPSVISGALARLVAGGYLLREAGAASRATSRYALPSEPAPTVPKSAPAGEIPRPRPRVVSSAAAQRLRELG